MVLIILSDCLRPDNKRAIIYAPMHWRHHYTSSPTSCLLPCSRPILREIAMLLNRYALQYFKSEKGPFIYLEGERESEQINNQSIIFSGTTVAIQDSSISCISLRFNCSFFYSVWALKKSLHVRYRGYFV